MTTSYSQTLYSQAAREVRERGFIGGSTYLALVANGYSSEAIGSLEATLKDKATDARA
jgi:hypothetical protein